MERCVLYKRFQNSCDQNQFVFLYFLHQIKISHRMTHFQLSQSFNPSNQLSFKPKELSQQSSESAKIEEFTSPIVHLPENPSFYEEEIKKLNQINMIVRAQLSSAIEEKKIIMNLISAAEQHEKIDPKQEKEKRLRRTAKDIERKCICPYEQCQKSYGSQGSLAQHVRLKHPKTNTHDPPLINDPF